MEGISPKIQESGYLISRTIATIDTWAGKSVEKTLDCLEDFKNRSRQQERQTVGLTKGRLRNVI